MHAMKQKKLTLTLSRTLIAGSCSALLLLGAAGATAEHHEDATSMGKMNEQKTTEKTQESVAAAKEDVTEVQEKVSDATSDMGDKEEKVAAAKDEVSEAKEGLAAAKEDVAQEKQELSEAQDQHQEAMAEKLPTVERTASSIIGKKIKNSSGDDVGEVSDIGIDWENAKASFVVISSGGVMGVGGDMYKVPLERLSAAANKEYFTMETTEKDLKSEFSKFEPLDERGEQ